MRKVETEIHKFAGRLSGQTVRYTKSSSSQQNIINGHAVQLWKEL
jgi:hypothetical protein